MNPYVAVFGVIFLVSLAIPALLYLLRHFFFCCGKKVRHISGTTFSLFASLYAFFLGFYVVSLWNDFGVAKSVVADEANAIHAAHYYSCEFRDSVAFREALGRYARSVMTEEWAVMNRDLTMNPHTHALYLAVWEAFRALRPENKEDNILYVNLGNQLLESSRQRNARQLLLCGNIYPPVWVIIIFGFFGSCLALFCANPDQEGGQLLMEFVVVFTVLSCIYFIYDISSPFSGIMNIPPDAFRTLLVHMRETDPAVALAVPAVGASGF